MVAINMENLSSPASRGLVLKQLDDLLRARFTLDGKEAEKSLPIFDHNKTGLQFRLIPSGRFVLGFGEQEELAARRIKDPLPMKLDHMRPTREIRVEAFLMSLFPVTGRVFRELGCGLPERASAVETGSPNPPLPSVSDREMDYPMMVPYEVADRFARGVGFQLPSEIQWEYACRGGIQALFPWGNELPGYEELDQWLELRVGERRGYANGFGLYGLFGGEWCRDEYGSTHELGAIVERGDHVVKGGGALFWPWQDQEWIWCMPSMRLPESGLFADRRAGVRLVYEFM